MRTYKKILALALSAAMSLTLLAGCGGKDSTTDASGRVYWLNFKPESDSVL